MKYERYKYHYITYEQYVAFAKTKAGRTLIQVMDKAYSTGYYSPNGEYERNNKQKAGKPVAFGGLASQ